MCSTNVPKRRLSTLPTRKAGSSVRVAAVTPRLYSVLCIVVNHYVHVAPDTRARVQAVLDETGYRPNMTARNLRSGRTGLIALAVPELDNPYFAELTRFVVEAAEEH